MSITLTCVLGESRADADLQGFAGRLQHRHVSLTLDKHNLPRAAAAEETPVLFFQFHLQSRNVTAQSKFCSVEL